MNLSEDIKKQIVVKKANLARQFARVKPKKWWHTERYYKLSTWEIANTKPYLEYSIDEFAAYYPKHLAKIFGAVAIITTVIVLIFQDNIEDSFQFFLVVLILIAGFISYKSIPYDKNRHPQIVINNEGIYIAKIDALIKWYLLVDTYIRVEDNGDDGASYFLDVYYYCLNRNNFFDVEVPLQEINVNYKELAYAIEYIKMQNKATRIT
jgi:hypothetical protein